jgi:hypothetical protein
MEDMFEMLEAIMIEFRNFPEQYHNEINQLCELVEKLYVTICDNQTCYLEEADHPPLHEI